MSPYQERKSQRCRPAPGAPRPPIHATGVCLQPNRIPLCSSFGDGTVPCPQVGKRSVFRRWSAEELSEYQIRHLATPATRRREREKLMGHHFFLVVSEHYQTETAF